MGRSLVRLRMRAMVAPLCLLVPTELFAQESSRSDAASDQSQTQSQAESTSQPALELPRVVRRTQPVYPPGVAPRGVVRVGLIALVAADGSLGELAVVEGAGEPFDAEAVRTVRSWSFTPARQNGRALPSRVRLLVEFVPPAPPTQSATDAASSVDSPRETANPRAHRHGDEVEQGDPHLAVTVHGERALRTERRTASDVFIHREILQAAPHQDGVDTLSTVPGLVAGRGEGVAVAHAYSLRGFHAEHGQDIAFSVGGLPINLPSHIHGQGYADLNLLIPEVVDEVSVSEGNADPAQGDFAMAGSIDVGLGVDEEHRGLSSRTSYGSFNQFRQGLVWAPKEGHRESFGAAQFSDTQGYGERRAARSGSLLVQHRFGEGKLSLRAVGLLHTAHGQSAGLLRKSDVEQGRLCFECVYDDPSARDQAMIAQRAMAGFFVDYRGRQHATGSIGLWAGIDRFRARSNLTGYTLGTVNGSGEPLSDASEQINRTQSVGLTGRYRTEAFHWGRAVHGTLEVGSEARLDGVDQKKDLLDAALRDEVWSQKVDQLSTIAQLGLWADLDFELHERVHLRGGARASLLTYAVDDRAATEAHDHEAEPPDDHEAEPTQNAADALFMGPRASLEVDVTTGLSLLASYGHGYRSPQARTLTHDQEAEYSVVRSGDLGFRFGASDQVVLSGAGYLAYVGQDLVFEPHVGGLVNVGSSRRAGGLLHLRIHPIEELQGALSVNYVDARILQPSSAEHDEHDHDEAEGETAHGHSHGEPGDPVVGVAPLTMRLDLNWRKPLRRVGAHPLIFGVGTGFTYRSPKPLGADQRGEDHWGSPWLLLDASATVAWGPLELQLAAFNLLQRKYATEEYLSISTWDATGATPPSEDHHVAAGPPLSFLATLGLSL